MIDPFTREAYSRDPRNVAKKAETYLVASGIADTAYFGPEAEFYIFDSIRYATGAQEAFYYIDSIEGAWNTGRIEEGGNLGYKTAYNSGYFPVPPVDHYTDLRNEMVTRPTVTCGNARHPRQYSARSPQPVRLRTPCVPDPRTPPLPARRSPHRRGHGPRPRPAGALTIELRQLGWLSGWPPTTRQAASPGA